MNFLAYIIEGPKGIRGFFGEQLEESLRTSGVFLEDNRRILEGLLVIFCLTIGGGRKGFRQIFWRTIGGGPKGLHRIFWKIISRGPLGPLPIFSDNQRRSEGPFPNFLEDNRRMPEKHTEFLWRTIGRWLKGIAEFSFNNRHRQEVFVGIFV